MSPFRRPHSRTTLLALYSLALSLAVVLWGAEYKMAQYPEQGRAYRVMSPAKLLTERERPVRQRSAQALVAPGSPKLGLGIPAAWTALGPGRRAPIATCEEQLATVDCAAENAAGFTYFFFRPPPAHSVS
ncbi:MAG TPA: hypothetical protein VMD29_07220 [Terracidiphilus sp.]|nr:hypothetical protein [Terracidiphilus sp.]